MEQLKLDSNARADAIINRLGNLENARSTFEALYIQVNDYCDPGPILFRSNQAQEGTTNTRKYYDSTPTLALDRFAAAIDSSLTPHSQRWHDLVISDFRVNKSKPVRQYLDDTVDVMFAIRYSPEANFANQLHEVYRGLGKYGTAGLYIDDNNGNIQYKSIGLHELYIAEDAAGRVNTVYRKLKYTASQAAEVFGYDNLPDKIKETLKDNPDQKFDFIHAVEPNYKYNSRIKTAEGKKYKSSYVCTTTRKIISEGGFNTMPYAVSRYKTNPGEVYGRSCAIDCLPDMKLLNRMAAVNLRGAEKVVDPVMLASELGMEIGLNLNPGMFNYGLDKNGQPMFVPLQTGAQVEIGLEVLERQRRTINETFNITLFQILVDMPTATATEVEYRQLEKAALLAPLINRQRSELLGTIIARELDILGAAGKLPPIPEELLELRQGEYVFKHDIKIEYAGPFTRAMKADKAIAIMNTLNAAASMAQFDPDVIKEFNLPAAIREIAEINAVPADTLRDEEEIAQMKQAEAQQAQLQQIAQIAPVAAQTAKDFAQAQRAVGTPAVI